MQIGIIGGTGAEGRGLAARFASAGATVLVGSRQLDRAQATVTALRANAALLLEAATNAEVAVQSNVIFLVVPFAGLGELLETHRADFRPDSLIVDVVVPLTFQGGVPSVMNISEGSASEFIRARLPAHVRLAAALKTIPASILGSLGTQLECDDFVCGDSAEARTATIELLRMIPTLRPLDAGGLEAARTIERMTALTIAINKRYKVRDARFRVVGV
jgi:NADPH-dependent F420 reductase